MCILPFIHIATKTDGDVKLCCRSTTMGNITYSTLREIWNNDKYKEVRRKVLNNERPIECIACWRQEDIGVRSLRQRCNTFRLPEYISIIDSLSNDCSMPFRIPIIEAKLSNLCNLKCRMCHPLDSTSWAKDWNSISHLMEKSNNGNFLKVHNLKLTTSPYINAWEDNAQFWNDFDLLIPFIDRVEFAGGEPLIDQTHYKILEKLFDRADQLNIKYATNLTKLNFKAINIQLLWKKFKKVELVVSIDGINDIYNYIRQLGNYKTIKNNIDFIRLNNPDINISGTCTFQVYNIFTLPEIFDEFVETLNIDIISHIVSFPKFLSMQIIPSKLKHQISAHLMQYINSIDSKTHINWTQRRREAARNFTLDMVNSMNSADMSYLIPQFVEFSDTLDIKQNCQYTWKELLPELATHIAKINE